MADVEHLVRLMTEEYDKKEPEYDSIICLYVQVLISKTIRWIEGEGKGRKTRPCHGGHPPLCQQRV